MDIDKLCDRATRLREISQGERKIELDAAAAKVSKEHAARGMRQSGNHILALAKVQLEALPHSVEDAWKILKEVHHSLGAASSQHVRDAMKSWIVESIKIFQHQASSSIAGYVRHHANALQNKAMLNELDTTERAAHSLAARYDIAIDNYMDTLMNHPKTTGAITINAQTIGAVLTGDGATAHVLQSPESMAKMAELLSLMRDAISRDSSLNPQRQRELLEIADEVKDELSRSNPNETKLMTLFSLLTQSVQTLPAALPAYEAARALLAGFGIPI